MITDVETYECSDALIEWFKSQGCDPADGSLVMLRLMASQLVAKTTDAVELDTAIKHVMLVLTLNVVDQLSKRNASN